MTPAEEDHCRIGSLEMDAGGNAIPSDDHCRIGSLESLKLIIFPLLLDHCRIGSLEIHRQLQGQTYI